MFKNLLIITVCIFFGLTSIQAQKRNFYRCSGYGAVPVKTPGGYTNISELTMGVGLKIVSVPYSTNLFGASMVNGYHFTPFFMAGIGIGVQAYKGGALAPVYLDARYYIRLKCLNPFVMMDAGGLFKVSGEEAKTGTFIFPGVGVRLPLDKSLSLTAAAGIHSQWINVDGYRDSFLSLKLGLVFF